MRKEEESKTERAKKLPGSGNIWNPKPKKYNFNYDYTKHEISQREFKNAKGINSLSKVRKVLLIISLFCQRSLRVNQK